MRRPFQRCVYHGGSTCSCWDIALWVRRPTLSLLEAEKSVDKGFSPVAVAPSTKPYPKHRTNYVANCTGNPENAALLKWRSNLFESQPVDLVWCAFNFAFSAEIDECSLGVHSCPPQFQCRNTFGAYDCDCNRTGWYFNFKSRSCEGNTVVPYWKVLDILTNDVPTPPLTRPAQ